MTDSLSPPSCLEWLLSVGGQSTSRPIVYFALFEWGAKSTNIAFNIGNPTIISALGDGFLGAGSGAIAYTYLEAIIKVLTALCFLTATPLLDTRRAKLRTLIGAGFMCAGGMTVLVVCYTPSLLYLACIIICFSKVAQSVANIALEMLLDDVARAAVLGTAGCAPVTADVTTGESKQGEQLPPGGNARATSAALPHTISSRASATGYVGMVAYIAALAVPVALLYFVAKASTLWVQGLVVSAVAGAWYAACQAVVARNLPKALDVLGEEEEPPAAKDRASVGGGGGLLCRAAAGAAAGLAAQVATTRALPAYGDLSLFIVAYIFLAAAASTALSAASIIATNVLQASVFYLAAATFVGVIAAIAGLLVFRTLVDRRCLSVKHALLINCVVNAGAMLYVLYAKSVTDLFVVAAIAGSQVGPINAFARSIVSRLTPSHEQSRFFSLFEFSQESTGWIGPLVVAAVTQSGGGSGAVFARTSVFTCLAELAVAVLLLLPMNLQRGEARRDGADADQAAAAGAGAGSKGAFGLDGVEIGADGVGAAQSTKKDNPYSGQYQEESSY